MPGMAIGSLEKGRTGFPSRFLISSSFLLTFANPDMSVPGLGPRTRASRLRPGGAHVSRHGRHRHSGSRFPVAARSTGGGGRGPRRSAARTACRSGHRPRIENFHCRRASAQSPSAVAAMPAFHKDASSRSCPVAPASADCGAARPASRADMFGSRCSSVAKRREASRSRPRSKAS